MHASPLAGPGVSLVLMLAGLFPMPGPRHSVIQHGTVAFHPIGDQTSIPKPYRLPAHQFGYKIVLKQTLPHCGVEISELRFPSPVISPSPQNNTVYCEYYRPLGPGPYPGVIVLDITGGDQSISRTIARSFAQNGIAALFVQMAYYGPRRPPGSRLRLLSTNFQRTLDGIRQTVLDIRRATAWLASRPEINADRLGIHGTSLGSMIGALSAEMEPRLKRVSICLGGGALVAAFYDHPRAETYRKIWEALGGTKEQVIRLFSSVDPITCAANLKKHEVLFIAARRDEIVPAKATLALWQASGRQRILWYDCTHYGAAFYFLPIVNQVERFFLAP